MTNLGTSVGVGLRGRSTLAALVALAALGGCGVAQAEPGVVLQSADGTGLSFEQSSVPAPEGQSTTVTVRAEDGGTVQVISTPYKGWLDAAAIELSDLDLDGREELLIEIDGRTVDHRWAVWRASGRSLQFSPAGVVTGHPENAGPDVVKVVTREGGCQYTFKEGILTPTCSSATASRVVSALPGGAR